MVEHRYSSTTHTSITYSTVACSVCKVIHWCHFLCPDVQQEVPFIYFNGYCTDRQVSSSQFEEYPNPQLPQMHTSKQSFPKWHTLFMQCLSEAAVLRATACAIHFRRYRGRSGEIIHKNTPVKHTWSLQPAPPPSLHLLSYTRVTWEFFFITSLWY